MSEKLSTQTPMREFAIWRANGESFITQGESLHQVARKWKIQGEPGTELIAIVDRAHMVKADAVKHPEKGMRNRPPQIPSQARMRTNPVQEPKDASKWLLRAAATRIFEGLEIAKRKILPCERSIAR